MENEYIELEKLDLVKKELIENPYIIKQRAGVKVMSLSILFICFGTIALFYKSLSCLLFYLPSSIVLFSYQAVLIDAVQKKVREYSSICGHKYGNWYKLEKFDFILVSTSGTVGKNGFESIAHVVYLHSKNRDKQHNVLIGGFSDRNKAIEHANNIGVLINFPVKINKFN